MYQNEGFGINTVLANPRESTRFLPTFDPLQDPFYQLCVKAFRDTPPADDSYEECCKIVESQIDGFMAAESVRS